MPALLFSVASTAGAAPRPACPEQRDIPFGSASSCVGEHRRVSGRLYNVSRPKNGLLFINFCADWRSCPFTAVVKPAHVPKFADLDGFVGAEISVEGEISTYQGRPEMVLTSRQQVVVREMPPPVDAPARLPAPVVTAYRRLPPTHETYSRVAVPEPVSAPQPVEPARPPQRRTEARRQAPAELGQEPVQSSPSDSPEPAMRAGVADAGKHVGEHMSLRGQISRLDFSGTDLVLYFSKNGAEVPFVAVITEPMLEALLSAAESWNGKLVDVEGDVGSYEDRPSIFITAKDQIRRVK